MATNPIKITINRQTGQIISFKGSESSIPDLFQNDVRDLQVQYVDSPADPTQLETVADMVGYTLGVYFSDKPIGVGGPAPIAQNIALTWDPANKWFTGALDLTPTPVSTLLGTNASVTGKLEFDLKLNGNKQTSCQPDVNLRAVSNKGASTTPPVSIPPFLNANETAALYVPWVIPAGFRVRFLTSDPHQAVELRVGDDLQPHWETVAI